MEQTVIWESSPGRYVYAGREEMEYIFSVMDRFDAVVFVWHVPGGYIFALLPRKLWHAVN